MIRQSVVAKTTALITGLVLLVLAILYVTLTQLFANAAFQNVLTGPSGESLAPLMRIAQWLFVLAGLGGTLLAIGLAMILSNQLSRPLIQMAKATQSIISGTYGTRVSVSGQDEVARLGHAINELALNLEFLNTSRNQFLADISHELRTPLSYIHGYAEVLKEGLVKTDVDRQQYLNIIYDESTRLEHLIKNLFDLAQADEGILNIQPVDTDIPMLVERVASHLMPFAVQKNIQLQLHLTSIRSFRVDPIRLEQVIFNLVDNAIQYTPPNGNVLVVAKEVDGSLEIQVSDTGQGIPEVDLPHIWERLYRVDKSRSRTSGGSGLGLAIVKQIVELHGGAVVAQSVIKKGTTISIRIPSNLEQ